MGGSHHASYAEIAILDRKRSQIASTTDLHARFVGFSAHQGRSLPFKPQLPLLTSVAATNVRLITERQERSMVEAKQDRDLPNKVFADGVPTEAGCRAATGLPGWPLQ